MIVHLIISGLWAILGGVVIISNLDLLLDAAPADRMLASLIMIIFAPVFGLNNILEIVMDILLGIDDNDDEGGSGFSKWKL